MMHFPPSFVRRFRTHDDESLRIGVVGPNAEDLRQSPGAWWRVLPPWGPCVSAREILTTYPAASRRGTNSGGNEDEV